MEIITSKQLYDLITDGKMNVTLATSRYYSLAETVEILDKEKFMRDLEAAPKAGLFDIIEWRCYANIDGVVVATADLHDQNAGNYIEVLGTVSGGLSVKQFEEALKGI